MTAIPLFLLGLVTGVLGGFLGVGGGLVITVVLLEVLKAQGMPDDVRYHVAFGTTLVGIIGTALSSSFTYARMGRVIWRVVAIVSVSAVLFSLIGSKLAAESSANLLHTVFIAFCFVMVVLLLTRKARQQADGHVHSAWKLLTIGAGAGLLSAYLGVAGGAVMVPTMILWAHVAAEYAPGTSNAVGVLTSLVGAVGYMIHGAGAANLPAGSWGFIVPAYAIPLFFGTLIGGPFGSQLNKRYGRDSFRYVFAAFLLVVAVKMWFEH
ncbi:sulfite exporter TauE/SafE family protein [candidate division KSB1 bacterium]|nr:sulfite exporter TauE/SafE family protein [candidate division KSB1 bacterium]